MQDKKYYNCSRCRKTYVTPPSEATSLRCSCGDQLDEILLDDAVAPGGIFYQHPEIKRAHVGVHAWMEQGFVLLDSRRALKGILVPEIKITPVKGKPVSWTTEDGSEGAIL